VVLALQAWLPLPAIGAEAAATGKAPAATFIAPAATTKETGLRLNDIQVLGSHNSYKLQMAPENFAALTARRPELAQSLEYWHIPIEEQLSLGIRKLELDVFYDPDGTHYQPTQPTQPTQPAGNAQGSQFRVMHVQNLDNRSNCPTLVACLAEIESWSQMFPGHVPIFISFNAKDAAIDQPGYVVPLPFGEEAWQALDAELRGVLGAKLLTPAEIFASGERVWPLLDNVRGRVVAILDEGGAKLHAYAGAESWRERAMFANLPETQPGAAILIINDPIAGFARIGRLVDAGFIVRTRADADTREARAGDYTRSHKAFASGAQLISTDYYLPAAHFTTGYVVELPGGPRCNRLRRPQLCQSLKGPIE
jgi:hypothetical protein